MASDLMNRREEARMLGGGRVEMLHPQYSPGGTVDQSRNGARVHLARIVEPGQVLTLLMHRPSCRIRRRAQVVWARTEGAGCVAGVRLM